MCEQRNLIYERRQALLWALDAAAENLNEWVRNNPDDRENKDVLAHVQALLDHHRRNHRTLYQSLYARLLSWEAAVRRGDAKAQQAYQEQAQEFVAKHLGGDLPNITIDFGQCSVRPERLVLSGGKDGLTDVSITPTFHDVCVHIEGPEADQVDQDRLFDLLIQDVHDE